MPTKLELISDIELRLYQGKPSDDSELPTSQISYWIDLYRDVVITDSLNDKIKKKEEVEPFYILKEECLTQTKETTACDDDDCTEFRYSIELTNDVLPLVKDGGVVRVVNHKGSILAKTTQNDFDILSNLPFGGASTANQSFYRENKKIFISESTTVSSGLYSYHVFYIPKGVGFTTTDTDPYPLEDSLLPVLLDMVEDVARRQMNQGVADLDNDGKDPYHK
jgi:hypothetical protein